MLKAIPTKNALLIREIMTEGKLWEQLSEDHAPAKEDWMPDMRYPWLVLTREIDDMVELYGVVAFIPQTPIVYKFHPAFLPDKWGDAQITDLTKLALDWAWKNLPVQKIVASVPVIYKSTLRLGQRVGFKREGINKKSFLKDGILHDQYYLGLTRE